MAKARMLAMAPPEDWLRLHRWPLMAAPLPASVRVVDRLALEGQERFCCRLHLELAVAMAERLRRR